jgi:hypothetical protein
MPSITDEEAAAIRERRRHPPVHAEVGRPAYVVHPDVGSEPLVYERNHRIARRWVSDGGMGLVNVDEDDPTVARQGPEEDEPVRADDDGPLVGRYRESQSSNRRPARA